MTLHHLRSSAAIAGAILPPVALIGRGLARAASSPWPPGPIPTFDVADYVVRAQEWRKAIGGETGVSMLDLALQPDPHPAGHPALLGLALWLWPGHATESGEALVLHCLALVLLPAAGCTLFGIRGLVGGVFAAGLTHMALLEQSMLLAPMTEPLAQVFTILGLAATSVAMRRTTTAPFLLAGLTFVAASFTRFHLGPLLLASAAVALGVTRRMSLTARARALGWLSLPLLVVVALIAVVAPEYSGGVLRFLGNADSGLGLFTAANGSWMLGLAERQVFGRPWFGLALVSVFGLLRAVWGTKLPEELAPWVAFVFFGGLAMFVHPFKEDRNIYVLIGPTYATLGIWVATSSAGSSARSLTATSIGILALIAVQMGTSGRQTEQYYSQDPNLATALDSIERASAPGGVVVVAGAQRELSESTIAYALTNLPRPATLVAQPDYPPVCATPRGAELEDCAPGRVTEAVALGASTIVLVEATAGPAARRRAWTAGLPQAIRTIVEQNGFSSRVVDLPQQNLRLTIATR